MGDKTGIEWSDATWSPLIGCRRVSEGCRHCYAERQAIRIARYKGIVESTASGPRWTGASRLVVEALDQPLRWRKPRRIFVDSMADLFFEGHSNEDIAAVFGVMAAAPQHTFQVLTKRPARAREWFAWAGHVRGRVAGTGEPMTLACDPLTVVLWKALDALGTRTHSYERVGRGKAWPLPNVWLGVSAETQATLDERAGDALACPAAVHFCSYEPALGPVNFTPYLIKPRCNGCYEVGGVKVHREECPAETGETALDWIIAGSESGPGARPAELEWFRSVRDQCAAAGVSFFFKQWMGKRDGLRSLDDARLAGRGKVSLPVLDGRQHAEWPR